MKKILCMILFFGLFVFVSFAQADVTLEWSSPTTNADGTPLTDLAGFKMYEVSVDTYTEIADIPVGTNTATITMGAGDRCFVGTAYDTSGNESIYSNEVCKDTLAPETYILNIK